MYYKLHSMLDLSKLICIPYKSEKLLIILN